MKNDHSKRCVKLYNSKTAVTMSEPEQQNKSGSCEFHFYFPTKLQHISFLLYSANNSLDLYSVIDDPLIIHSSQRASSRFSNIFVFFENENTLKCLSFKSPGRVDSANPG